MKRGRPPKQPPKPSADCYRCSACDFVSKKFGECDRHIQLKHYGQALINENRPLTETERLSGFNRSIKLVKIMKCSNCPKSFKSGLGFKFHLELCGKDESLLFEECEICGQRLRIHSMMAHMKGIHANIFEEQVASKKGEKSTPAKKSKKSLKVEPKEEGTPVSKDRIGKLSSKNSSNKSRKRSSAIKALNSFKEFIDDGDEEISTKKLTKKKKKDKDEEFKLEDDDLEVQILDDDLENDLEEVLVEEEKIEESDNDSSKSLNSEEESGDEEDGGGGSSLNTSSKANLLTYRITRKDLEEIFFLIKDYILRKPKVAGAHDMPEGFERKLLDLEMDSIANVQMENEDDVMINTQQSIVNYRCYNEQCSQTFPFRIEMENHFRKGCTSTEFTFVCSICQVSSPSTTATSPDFADQSSDVFESNFINLPMGQHFFFNHKDLFSESNRFHQKWISHFDDLFQHQNGRVSSGVKRGRKSQPMIDLAFSAPLSQQSNENQPYCSELLEYYRDNCTTGQTFQCLKYYRDSWKTIAKFVLGRGKILRIFNDESQQQMAHRNTHPDAVLSSVLPRFKSTTSMDSGDNQFKFLPKFTSLKTSANKSSSNSGFTFNVGQAVTAAAWLPIPYQQSPTDPSHDNPIRLSSFDKIQQAQETAGLDQYMMLATSCQIDVIMGSKHPNNCLQLWNMGPCLTKSDTQLESLPKLSLLMEHRYGVIDELSWCPYGTTYDYLDDEDNERLEKKDSNNSVLALKRLGLLALACPDGTIKLHSVVHPKQLVPSTSSSSSLSTTNSTSPVIYEMPQPNLILSHPNQNICKLSSCRTLSWKSEWPQDLILGGFSDGWICCWNLEDIAKCDQEGEHRHEIYKSTSLGAKVNESPKSPICRKPWKTYRLGKAIPILSIRWINQSMFATSSLESVRLWHLWYPGHYAELKSMGFFHKLERHPMWYHALAMVEFMINRTNTLIYMRSYIEDEFDMRNAHVLANCSHTKDLSISPWMYIMAYGTDNGELVTTEFLPRPNRTDKKSKNFLMYSVHLGNLIEFDQEDEDGTEEEEEDDDTDLETEVDDGAENDLNKLNGDSSKKKKKEKHKKVKDKQINNVDKKKKPKVPNQILNKTVDLNFSYKDFFLKYFFIFNDCDKKTELNPIKMAQCSMPLTKNDLLRFYSISHCCWNPNLSSYSWLFSATRSGLCRINKYNLVKPDKI